MTKRIPITTLIATGLALQVFGLAPSVMSQCNADEMKAAPIALKVHTWVPLGGQFKLGLSAQASKSSKSDDIAISVNGVGSDGTRWGIESKDGGKTWGELAGHGGKLSSAPACDRDNAYQGTRCFWVSDGGFLWSQLGDGEFVGGISGMKATADPGVFDNGFGDMYVFAHNADDNALWFAATKDGKLAGKWTSLGGELQGQPSCLKTGEHHVGPAFGGSNLPDFSCFVLGSDGVVWAGHEAQAPSQFGNPAITTTQYVWESIGGEALGGVDAFRTAYASGTGNVMLAVRGTDSALWIAHQESTGDGFGSTSEWKWKRYPGEIASVPSCALTYCFAVLPDGQLGFLDLTGRL